jgi:signal peptide peptidase SppA
MIHQRKLDVIISALGPRLVLPIESLPAKAVGPGDPKERKDYTVTSDGIAIISVAGSLVRRSSWMDAASGLSSYEEIEEEFVDAATDPEIKGILLDIDSPGGEVSGVFDLVDEMYSQRGSKPIVSIANDDMYSAGYAIGSVADQIFVTRTGGMGSIGVIAAHLDLTAYDEKEGFKYTFIYAGERKNDLNPHVPLSSEVEDDLQEEIDRLYDMFCSTVARNRGMSLEDVQATEAAMYFGPNAIQAGLADQIGTRGDALATLSRAIADPAQRLLSMTGKKSRTHLTKSEVSKMAETVLPQNTADKTAQAPPAAPLVQGTPAAPNPGAAPLPAATAQDIAVMGSAFSAEDAEEIIDLCQLAGKDLKTAQGFISRKMKPADVRKQLATERAAKAGENEIRSTVGTEMSTSAEATSVENSPVVQAAQRRNDQQAASKARQESKR